MGRRGWPFAVLFIVTVAFLWTPLRTGGYYTSADVLQGSALLRVPAAQPVKIKNGILGDPVFQMLPFERWNHDQLRQGRLPLWNPYNGGGTPHIANYQSAVFSPFSAPFYVLPFRPALIAAAFLKLFALGAFTFLFLRRLGLGRPASLVGGLVYMFAGYNVVWLSWPQPATAAALPALLFAVESFLRTNPAARGPRLGWLAGVAAATALGLLAGHPETFYFSSLVVGGYVILRVAPLPTWRRRVGQAMPLLGASILGALLAAIQLVPFVEYLGRSTAAARDYSGNHLALRLLPLQFFPNLLGSPTDRYDNLVALKTNYNEVTGPYVGLVVLMLAVLGLVVAVRRTSPHRRLAVFLVAAGGLWWLYAFNPGGVRVVFSWIPGLSSLAPSRSHVVWLIALAVLAAFGMDTLDKWACASQQAARRKRALAIVGGGLVLIGGAVLVGELLASWVRTQHGGVASTSAATTYVDQHLKFVVAVSLVAVAAAACALLSGRRRVARGAALAIVVAAVLAQSAWTFRHFNPTIPAALFYPRSPAEETVTRLTGDQMTLHLQGALVWPDTNLWYRFPSTLGYDAVGIKSYDLLAKSTLGTSDAEDTARPRNIQALRALGIRFVVTTGTDPLAGTQNPLQKVWEQPPLTLFKVPDSPARYFTVGSSDVVASQEDARGRLTAPDFDVNRTVLLRGNGARAGASPVTEGGGATTVVEHESPTSVRLAVHSTAPGWTVFLRSNYPGWTATVNGRRARLVEANAAFSAVAVPAGASTVALSYRPTSVRTGAVISAAGLVVLLALAGGAAVIGRRGRSRSVSGS